MESQIQQNTVNFPSRKWGLLFETTKILPDKQKGRR